MKQVVLSFDFMQIHLFIRAALKRKSYIDSLRNIVSTEAGCVKKASLGTLLNQ